MAFPNQNFSLNLQKQGFSTSPSNSCANPSPRPRNILRALRRRHVSRGFTGATHEFSTSPSNSCPNPAPTPGRKILRALRRGHVSQKSRGPHGFAMSSSNSCPNSAPAPRSFQLDIKINTAEHSALKRIDRNEREQPLSATVKSSLNRRWLGGGLLSYKSVSSPSAPPLPPREHKPKAAEINEDNHIDKLQLALTLSREDTKEKSSKTSTYEGDFILSGDIEKMKLEDPENEEENICVICMDKPKTHAYIPCGHRVVCVKCSEELKTKGKLNCVICRKEAHGIFKIF